MPLPIAIAAATAAAAGIATAIAEAIAAGQEAEAQRLYQEGLAQYGDIIKPQLDNLVAQQVPDTAFLAITEDPTTRGAQLDAMGQLRDIVASGGMTLADEAALQLANQGAAQRAGSDYQSLQQQLAARGQAGNPALMAAAMGNVNQNVVNATATNRYRAQADAMARRMRAIEAMGGLAGNVRGQDYNVASDRANALDRFAAYNADKRTATDLANREGAQKMFGNEMAVLDRQNDMRENLAGEARRRAGNTRRTSKIITDQFGSIGAAGVEGFKK